MLAYVWRRTRDAGTGAARLQRRIFEVDHLQARPQNPNGLDELKIARILAADGIKPYLPRPGHYGVDQDGVLVPGTRWDENAEGVKRVGKNEPTYQLISCNVLSWGRQLFRAFATSG